MLGHVLTNSYTFTHFIYYELSGHKVSKFGIANSFFRVKAHGWRNLKSRRSCLNMGAELVIVTDTDEPVREGGILGS